VEVDADLADVVTAEEVEEVMQDGPVGDRHHRLGEEVRQGTQARAKTRRHDHRLHGATSSAGRGSDSS
jgi:hypothetical protein